MHTRLRFLGTLFLLFITTHSAAADPLLTYHGNDGDRAKYSYSSTSSTKSVTDDGTVIKGTVKLQISVGIEYLGVNSDNTLLLRGDITSGTITANLGGKKKTIALPPSTTNYIMTPQGEIKVRDMNDISIQEGIQIAIAPDDAFLLHGVGILPKIAPKIGDTWKGTVTLRLPSGGEQVELKYDSKVIGQRRYAGNSCRKIRTNYRAFVEFKSMDSGYATRVKDNETGSITWIFDPTRGLVLSIDGTKNLTLTTLLDPDGEARVIRTTMTMSERSRLVEFKGEKVTVK